LFYSSVFWISAFSDTVIKQARELMYYNSESMERCYA